MINFLFQDLLIDIKFNIKHLLNTLIKCNACIKYKSLSSLTFYHFHA